MAPQPLFGGFLRDVCQTETSRRCSHSQLRLNLNNPHSKRKWVRRDDVRASRGQIRCQFRVVFGGCCSGVGLLRGSLLVANTKREGARSRNLKICASTEILADLWVSTGSNTGCCGVLCVDGRTLDFQRSSAKLETLRQCSPFSLRPNSNNNYKTKRESSG